MGRNSVYGVGTRAMVQRWRPSNRLSVEGRLAERGGAPALRAARLSRGADGVVKSALKSAADARHTEHIPIRPHFYNRRIHAHGYGRSSDFRLFAKYFFWMTNEECHRLRDDGKSVLKSERDVNLQSVCFVVVLIRSDQNQVKKK